MTVFLRRTQKLAAQLPVELLGTTASDTALGDWYVNRLIVDRKPLLLSVASNSLLAILIPARDVASLPTRLAVLVGLRLQRMRIPEKYISAELSVMRQVIVAKTADRSAVGIMVDFANMIPAYLPIGVWSEGDLLDVEDELAKNPCFAGIGGRQTVIPDDETFALLAKKWDD